MEEPLPPPPPFPLPPSFAKSARGLHRCSVLLPPAARTHMSAVKTGTKTDDANNADPTAFAPQPPSLPFLCSSMRSIPLLTLSRTTSVPCLAHLRYASVSVAEFLTEDHDRNHCLGNPTNKRGPQPVRVRTIRTMFSKESTCSQKEYIYINVTATEFSCARPQHPRTLFVFTFLTVPLPPPLPPSHPYPSLSRTAPFLTMADSA